VALRLSARGRKGFSFTLNISLIFYLVVDILYSTVELHRRYKFAMPCVISSARLGDTPAPKKTITLIPHNAYTSTTPDLKFIWSGPLEGFFDPNAVHGAVQRLQITPSVEE